MGDNDPRGVQEAEEWFHVKPGDSGGHGEAGASEIRKNKLRKLDGVCGVLDEMC